MTTQLKTPVKVSRTFVVSPPAPIDSVCPDAETATAINHLVLAWFAEQIAAEIKRRRGLSPFGDPQGLCYNISKGETTNGV